MFILCYSLFHLCLLLFSGYQWTSVCGNAIWQHSVPDPGTRTDRRVIICHSSQLIYLKFCARRRCSSSYVCKKRWVYLSLVINFYLGQPLWVWRGCFPSYLSGSACSSIVTRWRSVGFVWSCFILRNGFSQY